jgi:cytochrome c-type biogenesis protein CcmH
MALQPPTAERYTGLAEALLFQGQGVMPEEGVKAIQQALALDPKDSKARYYEALALAQDGKSEAALAKFNALLAEAPADAPYREAVQRQIDLVNAGKAARPNGPTADQVAAAGNMSAGDQQQMIRGMVDGLTQKLAANPKDLSGWLRLIRARSVLGDLDLAKTALATARTTFTSDAGAIEQINALAKELNLP